MTHLRLERQRHHRDPGVGKHDGVIQQLPRARPCFAVARQHGADEGPAGGGHGVRERAHDAQSYCLLYLRLVLSLKRQVSCKAPKPI